MESETRRKIKETVLEVVKNSNINEGKSETRCLKTAGVGSFWLGTQASEREAKPNKDVTEDLERIICQLPNKRNMVVYDFRGNKLVSIRDFYPKDGKLLPSANPIGCII